MPRGRHRVEPDKRPLLRLPLHLPSRLPRHLPRRLSRPVVAGGVGVALLSGTLVVTLWPDTEPASRAVVVTDAQRDAELAAAALAARREAGREEEERISRSRARPSPTPSKKSSAATKPKKKLEPVPDVVGRRWATTDVNIRSGPSADHKRIGSLKAITRIGITGVTKKGWTQVVTKKRAGWIKSSYLSKSKPKPKSESTGVSNAPCSISSEIEANLTANARAVYRAVCAAFGDTVSSFGGYRAGDDGDHGSGKAVDIMVSGDPGMEVARYVQAHAKELGVSYVIYQQKIWMAGDPTSQWELMEDRGSTTANHYDHVHVSVN